MSAAGRGPRGRRQTVKGQLYQEETQPPDSKKRELQLKKLNNKGAIEQATHT